MQKTIFITAGASGIGLAVAEAFAAKGYAVAVSDVDPKALKEVEKKHPDFLCFEADVTSESDTEKVFKSLESEWSELSVLAANAGTTGPAAAIDEIALSDWEACLGVNLRGAFLTCRLGARWMKRQQSGVITLTSSNAGLFGYPYRAPYAAAKWGVIGLMKTLAMELGDYGIRVNAICPGSVEGPRMGRVIANEAIARNMTEAEIRKGYEDCSSLRRFVTKTDIANMAVFLASEEAKNISGVAMSVDGHTEKITI